MTWWMVLLIALAAGALTLVVGGLRLLLPIVMAWCFAVGIGLVITQGDWRVPTGVAMIGAGTSYIFTTIALRTTERGTP